MLAERRLRETACLLHRRLVLWHLCPALQHLVFTQAPALSLSQTPFPTPSSQQPPNCCTSPLVTSALQSILGESTTRR